MGLTMTKEYDIGMIDNNITYAQFVAALVKPPEELLNSLSPEQMNLIHMVMGISGEAGELLDAIKKFAIYNKPLDITNVIEELGDLMFYIEGIKNALNITDSEILQHNITKLSKRYESLSYSDKAAVERKDKTHIDQETDDESYR